MLRRKGATDADCIIFGAPGPNDWRGTDFTCSEIPAKTPRQLGSTHTLQKKDKRNHKGEADKLRWKKRRWKPRLISHECAEVAAYALRWKKKKKRRRQPLLSLVCFPFVFPAERKWPCLCNSGKVLQRETCELRRLPHVTVTPPGGACQSPCCPQLAAAGLLRDTGLQQAMTLPDMWWVFGEQNIHYLSEQQPRRPRDVSVARGWNCRGGAEEGWRKITKSEAL